MGDYVGDMSGCVCPVSYRFWPFSPSQTGLKFDHTFNWKQFSEFALFGVSTV